MEKYIGVDVHARTCTFAVISQGGRSVKKDVVETNGSALVEYVKQIAGTKYLVLEEGTQSSWIHEILRPHVQDIVVTMPTRRSGTKSDAADAMALAESLRIGGLKVRVNKNQGEFAALRERVRVYTKLLQDHVRAQNRIRAVFRSRGISSEGLTSIDTLEAWESWAKKLPPKMRAPSTILCEELIMIDALRLRASEEMLAEAKKHPIWTLLQTCPGLGKTRTAILMSIVVSPHRFRTSRQFWAYCGLAVQTRSSSDWRNDGSGNWQRRQPMTRGLNRNFNRELKEIFVGASMTVSSQCRSDPLVADYQKMIERGLKLPVARISLARKIAGIVLRMWKNAEVYDSAKYRNRK